MDNNQQQGSYGQQGYDPNAYSSYGQQQGGYGQQGYDPNAYANYYGQQQGSYGQQGYDPNAYANYYGQQQGYDQNAYAAYYNQGYAQQATADPNNPMRLTVSPSNPSTSSNNITLNLDSLYEKLSSEINKNNEPIDKFREIKDFLLYLIQNNAIVNVFSYLTDIESSIGDGIISTVNNNTFSVNGKVISLNYISYIKFGAEGIDDRAINGFFYNKFIYETSQNQNRNTKPNERNDFFNYLQSRRSFNQFVNIVVNSTFLTAISGLIVVDLNEDIAIFRTEEAYYMIPLDKIVTME